MMDEAPMRSYWFSSIVFAVGSCFAYPTMIFAFDNITDIDLSRTALLPLHLAAILACQWLFLRSRTSGDPRIWLDAPRSRALLLKWHPELANAPADDTSRLAALLRHHAREGGRFSMGWQALMLGTAAAALSFNDWNDGLAAITAAIGVGIACAYAVRSWASATTPEFRSKVAEIQ